MRRWLAISLLLPALATAADLRSVTVDKIEDTYVMRSEVCFDPSTLVYEVEADGFLRKMVRSLVGGLVAVGRGTHSVDDLAHGLEVRDRRAWPAPVEARGLSLVRVEYAVAEARARMSS